MNALAHMGDILVRLGLAVVVGVAIGLDREMRGKPVGVRTLALVALGAALACVAAVRLEGLRGEPDALSRVVQGVLQGVLTGVGFLGAGAVIRRAGHVDGLTTAATVWVTAALGIACGLASWGVTAAGVTLTLIVLVLLHPLDIWIDRRRERMGLPKQDERPDAKP
jgi:putative Mg2+ transporter-C (MgtC) family protein